MFKTMAKACLVPVYAAQQWIRPCKYLFLVGHMRSGSSLLTHILDTNPEITSYGETHLRYKSGRDVDWLVQDVFPTLRRLRLTRYVMDKVVQEHHLCDEVFRREDCYFIFLVRDPDASVRSMVRAFPTWKGKEHLDRDAAIAKAIAHYNARLRSISREAELIGDPNRAVFLRHADLVDRTKESFTLVQTMLGLTSPLSEEYSLSRTTGEFGKGDSSDSIRKGFIDRKIVHAEQSLDRQVLSPSDILFEDTCDRLQGLCKSLGNYVNHRDRPCEVSRDNDGR